MPNRVVGPRRVETDRSKRTGQVPPDRIGSADKALFERPAALARRDAWLALGHRRLVEALNLVALKAGGGSKDHAAESDSAWAAWRGERSEELVAKRRLRLEVERTHGRLKSEFPGQRTFVESFFPKQESTAGLEDEPSAPAVPAADPAAAPGPA